MSQQIMKQPDGLLAVFSSVTDTFVVVDATPEELVEWRAQQAAEAAREQTRRELQHVLADNPRGAYFQSARSWEEASALNRAHGGDL
ncbi:hypothetical protein [Streptomyces gardneri]|uniref:hypothetical protein n=1 Tax=Streptomyces gardneri TaxID=66892 RepID=UPI0035D64E11